MTIQATEIPDVKEIFLQVFPDERGSFMELYNQVEFAKQGIHDHFVQDNLSVSKQGVLRGLHFQDGEHGQGKLVGVIAGEVFDVAVDIRPTSSTFGQWVGRRLSSDHHNLLFIPTGFAHGFYVLSPEARFFYKCTNLYNAAASKGIRWDDKDIGVQWPLLSPTPIVSPADATFASFADWKASL